MLGTVALDQQARLFKLLWSVCMSVLLSPDQASLQQGQQTYLPSRLFDYVALDQHTCLKPSSYVFLQLHETSRHVAVSMF